MACGLLSCVMWSQLHHADFLVAVHELLVVACGLLVAACGLLVVTCMWDLVPQPGIEPGSPALGAQSLTHWTTREVPLHFLYFIVTPINWIVFCHISYLFGFWLSNIKDLLIL